MAEHYTAVCSAVIGAQIFNIGDGDIDWDALVDCASRVAYESTTVMADDMSKFTEKMQ